MEPSIVLSVTAAISMSDWERDAASNNNNNPPHHHGSTGSSDDDDEEGEFDYQHHHQNAPLASRWMHNTLTTTMTGMVAPPLFESPHLQYALPRNTPSYQTRETSRSETYPSSIYEYDPEAYASRLAFDAPTESAAIGVAAPASPFVTRAQYPSSYDDFGVIFPNELSSKQGHALEVDEDDRKPKATEVTIKNSPHRKSHSLSDDPFARYPAVDSADQERPDPYINPSLSFTDDDEMARQSETHFDMGHFGAVVDPRFQVAGYPAPCPNYAPPLAFKIGDSSPPSILLDRSSSSSASQESPLSPSILVKLRKNPEAFYRSPTHEELKAAGSDRAKSAVKTWYARFNELVAYKARYGHCNVPQKYAENPQLGIWVNKQRMEKKFMDEDDKRTSMTKKKVEVLQSIGFNWAKRKGNVSWMMKYEELRRFKEANGSCDVATKYTKNPALGRWVSTQRSEYKKFNKSGGRSKHMTQARADLLNDLGFKWEMMPHATRKTSPGCSSNASSNGGKD